MTDVSSDNAGALWRQQAQVSRVQDDACGKRAKTKIGRDVEAKS